MKIRAVGLTIDKRYSIVYLWTDGRGGSLATLVIFVYIVVDSILVVVRV